MHLGRPRMSAGLGTPRPGPDLNSTNAQQKNPTARVGRSSQDVASARPLQTFSSSAAPLALPGCSNPATVPARRCSSASYPRPARMRCSLRTITDFWEAIEAGEDRGLPIAPQDYGPGAVANTALDGIGHWFKEPRLTTLWCCRIQSRRKICFRDPSNSGSRARRIDRSHYAPSHFADRFSTQPSNGL